MKRMLLVCTLVTLVLNFTLPVSAVKAQETTTTAQETKSAVLSLQNEDVLKMIESGLSADIIVAKINASVCEFDTTPDALQKLKTANVPHDVILAMVRAPFGASNVARVGSFDLTASVEVRVPDGTLLEVELLSTISSATVKEGDVIDFTIVSPVVVDGVTVIEKGAPANARIAKVKKAGYWGKAGKLGWTMQEVLLIDGNRTALRMENKLTGDSKGGTVATGTIITAVVFWPAAPFWGLKKGKNAVYPAGKRFSAFVHGDVVVKGKPVVVPQTPAVSQQQESQLTAPVKP